MSKSEKKIEKFQSGAAMKTILKVLFKVKKVYQLKPIMMKIKKTTTINQDKLIRNEINY